MLEISGSQGKFYQKTALFCGGFSLLTGLFFLLGWYGDIYHSFNFPIGYTAIPYPSALCIFLIGLGICALFTNTRLPIANLIGIPIFLIALDRAFIFLTGADLGLSHLVPLWILPKGVNELQMSAIGALAFSLMGLLLMGWHSDNRIRWQSALSLLISSIIVAIGLIGVISYFLPMHLKYVEFESSLPINSFCSFLIVMLGIGLITAGNYFDALSGITVSKWLPILTTVCLAIISVLLSIGIDIEEKSPLKNLLGNEIHKLSKSIESFYNIQVKDLSLISDLIETKKSYHLTNTEPAITKFLDSVSALTQVAITDNRLEVMDTLPKTPSDVLPQPLPIAHPPFKSVIDSVILPKKTFASFISQEKGHFYLTLLFPLEWDAKYQGMLVYSFDLAKFLTQQFNNEFSDKFSVQFFLAKAEIAEINIASALEGKEWSQQGSAMLGKDKISFTLYPSSKLVHDYVNENVVVLTLVGGILISVCFGLLIHLWQTATDRIEIIESYRKMLLEMQEQQKTILDAAKIGIWSWDIKGDKITWDDYNFKLFETTPQIFRGKYQEFIRKVIPEDQDQLAIAVQQSLQSGKDFECTYRIVSATKKVKSVYSRGKVYYDGNQHPIKLSGINWELTSTADDELGIKIQTLSHKEHS